MLVKLQLSNFVVIVINVGQIIMESYSVEQRIDIISLYYQNARSVRTTFRALCNIYGAHNRPVESTIRRLVDKFESTGSVNNQKTPVRRRNMVRSVEKIAAMNESVQDNLKKSIPRRAQELGLSQTSTWRVLRRDLGLHPYKIQLSHVPHSAS